MNGFAQQDFSHLFHPGNIGKLRLKNRLVMAPMGNALADDKGYVTDVMLDYYSVRASGGVGFIITQCVSVNRDDMMPYSLALHDDSCLPGIKKLVEMIHGYDTRVAIQLMHPGLLLMLLPSLPPGMTVKVPSLVPMMTASLPYQVITAVDIEQYVADFTAAAQRAVAAGADAIEIHACHGCLLSTFLSPATNRRQDEYGGSVGNRARFTQQVIMAIRQRIGPDFPLMARINASEDVPGGITVADVLQQARILKTAGVDAISISSGLEYWSTLMAPPYSVSEGINLPVAEKIKESLVIPVITAGKVSPELAARKLREGKVDFIALGRPLLADPALPDKLRKGQINDIHRCIYCNNCLRSTWRSCSVNPFLYRENMLPLPKAPNPGKVMVVGGGIAGMQTAIFLKERGYQVSLYEKESELGGQWRIASAMPGKAAYRDLTDFQQRCLVKMNIPVILGVAVTRERVLAEKPDILVVATGAVPRPFNIPGIDLPHVVQANDIISGKAQAADQTVVIGGNLLGLELAASLVAAGKRVTLVSHGRLGGRKGADDKILFRDLMRKLIEARVPIYANVKIIEVIPQKLLIESESEVLTLLADTVILAVGVTPLSQLAEAFTPNELTVYTVGDCIMPGNAAQAIFSAARLAGKI